MNAAQYAITPAVTPQQLLPANPNRKTLWLIPTTAHTSHFSFGTSLGGSFGWYNTTSVPLIFLSYDQIGELITQPLWWSGFPTDTITVVEGFS